MLCALACESPTLPLPPPEAPMQYAGADADHVELVAGCGGAQPGAEILILNQTIANPTPTSPNVEAAVAKPCGSWSASVFAHTGDALQISQIVGGEVSEAALYTVR